MTHAGANIAGATLLLLAVAFAWHVTGDFRRGSAFFPYIVLALLGVCGALWLARSVVAFRTGRRGGAGEAAATWLGRLGGTVVLALTLIYGVVVVKVGYVYPSIAYLFVLALVLGGRRYVLISLVAVGFPLGVYYFLSAGLDRPLPF
jgi:hypothetical protein